MRTLIRVSLLLLLLVIPAALYAQGNWYDYPRTDSSGWSVTGTVTDINRSRETMELRDSARRVYRVNVSDARFYDRNAGIRLSDIREGDTVRVEGRLRERYDVTATRVYRLDRDSDEGYGRGDTTFTGRVSRVQRNDKWFALRDGNRTYKIRLTSRTDVYGRDGRRADIDDIRVGDQVRVYGSRRVGSQITASRVEIGSYLGGGGYRDERQVEARVIRGTSILNRTLRVEPIRGQRLPDRFDIQVARDALVTQSGRRISIHDIDEGDIVVAQGYWRSSDFIADRVEVRGYSWDDRSDTSSQRFYGRVADIDYRSREFTLSRDGTDYRVYAEDSKLRDGSRAISFSDIRKGDDIVIRGVLRERRVYATYIDLDTGRR